MEKHILTTATLIDKLTAETVNNLKRMVELGKKPDGQKLSNQDLESCMAAILLWEEKHLSESERSGYISQQCKSKEKTIKKEYQTISITPK